MRHRLRKHKILMKVFLQPGRERIFIPHLVPHPLHPVSDCSICAQNGIPSSLPWQLSLVRGPRTVLGLRRPH